MIKSTFNKLGLAVTMMTVMLLLALPSWSWLTVDPPVSGFTGISDGQTFTAPFKPSAIMGYAHKGYAGIGQSAADARMSYYTIDACRDVNQNGEIDSYEISRGMAFRTIARVSSHAIGWDTATIGGTDGTPGDLLNGTVVIWLGKGWWFLRVRAVDVNGNTSTEVSNIDQYFQQGAGIAVTENGNATYGWDDDSVVLIKVQ